MFLGISARVFLVLLRNQYLRYAAAVSRQQLLLQATDGQHFPAQA